MQTRRGSGWIGHALSPKHPDTEESLPAAERSIDAHELLRVAADSADSELGIVEISPDADGGYYVSELVFAPEHPELCKQP